MLTQVEFRSDAFPAYESEAEEVSPGRFGKRLAEFLRDGLKRQGEAVEGIFAEGWGWVVAIANPGYRLWIGVGNYEEYPDGFLCFIEPHEEHVRKLWRKIPTGERVALLQKRVDAVLRQHGGIRDIKWWTYDEFNCPPA